MWKAANQGNFYPRIRFIWVFRRKLAKFTRMLWQFCITMHCHFVRNGICRYKLLFLRMAESFVGRILTRTNFISNPMISIIAEHRSADLKQMVLLSDLIAQFWINSLEFHSALNFMNLSSAFGKILDQWLIHYNVERPHQGYRNMGCCPIDTINLFCKNGVNTET